MGGLLCSSASWLGVTRFGFGPAKALNSIALCRSATMAA
jgi:hypothetical protein